MPQIEDCREGGERAVSTLQDKMYSWVLLNLTLSMQDN